MLQEWLGAVENRYRSIVWKSVEEPRSYPNELGPKHWTEARFEQMMRLKQEALAFARSQKADYILFADTDSILTNNQTLKFLIAQNKSVVAPMMDSQTYYSNFWCGITPQGYYRRTVDYFPTKNRQRLGCFALPMVFATFLIDLRKNNTASLAFYPPHPTYAWPFDDINVFAYSCQVIIWMLTEKCKELEVQLEEHLKMQSLLAKAQKSNGSLFQQNLLLREELSVLKEELSQKLAKEHDQLKLLQNEQQRRLNAERLLKYTAQGLKEVLTERPLAEEEDGEFDVVFQLRRKNALHSILRFVQRSIAHLDSQQGLHPIAVESKVVKVTNLSRSFSSEWHTKASRTTSHCNIFKLPKPVHSLPSLDSLSSSQQLVTLRPYGSAKESILSWRTESNHKGGPHAKSATQAPEESAQTSEEVVIREDLPEIVTHLARQELLSK
ncbi:inactive glycosyltransferase 25 family member 3 [Pseudonaja textilis]|uniref:inactive glycosyltransferase 25 family member 3 n=1 Tax=Pseudonaja textilis TaxID=8673 RepID=UPI000EA9C41A|nr:inactive glycosyltransferase 25 family member 3 [Pseudonaja textilis]